MSPAEIKLAAKLLRKAADEFSNHGCNDFDLLAEGLTPNESLELRRSIRAWNADASEPEPDPDRHNSYDWLVMSYLASQLEKSGGEN